MFIIFKFARNCIRLCRRLKSTTTNIILKESLPTTAYQPEVVEKDKYAKWERSGLFKPNNTDKPVFSMVLPPPNVTGRLHLG